ncbi:MAG: beta-lactamase family protein, partial [Chlorobiales bacterium]|nr:beta-lactamase family protein [Chlorobiales bacterium]
KNGKIIYSRGYGMANLEHNITIKPDTVFYIGSTSKQFVAACIALLVLDNKINLEESITTYLPELPDLYKSITVRHMVHHTSGIRDYLALRHSFGTWNDHCTPEQVIQLIARQKALNFQPGEQYMYSNSGYFLLSEIVRNVSGKSLAEFAKERLFDRLGMKNTHFHDDYTRVVKNRAMGHVKGEDGFSQYVTTFDIVGSGGLYTTVEDLFLWDQMFHEKSLGEEFLNFIHQKGKLNSGEELDYAFGLRIDTYKGIKRVSHGGSYIGFKADLMRFPDKKFSVIVLSNLASFNPTARCREIADIYLEEEFVHEKTEDRSEATPAAADLTADQLIRFTGTYWIEQEHAIVKIHIK